MNPQQLQRLRVCNWFVTVDFRELALVWLDALVGRLRLGRSGRHSVDAAVGNVGGTHCARAAVESLRGRVGCGLVVCVGKQGLMGTTGAIRTEAVSSSPFVCSTRGARWHLRYFSEIYSYKPVTNPQTLRLLRIQQLQTQPSIHNPRERNN